MGSAATLAAAVALDLVLGEPPTRVHPVGAMGWCLRAGHERLRRGGPGLQVAGGALVTAATAGAAGAAAWAVNRGTAALPTRCLRLVAAGAALKPTFALRALAAEGCGVAAALEGGDLEGARRRLTSLVSRPTGGLSAALVASAACESLAENLTDSVVAPWLAHLLLGPPGATAYRVVNTADAMYGYRGELTWLGRGAAVSDDLANLVPARVAAALLVGAAALTSGPGAARAALRCWRRDAGSTRSPNAGQTMAAMAGALGRRLEKPGEYVLGREMPDTGADDVRRATRLVVAAAALLLGGALLTSAARREPAR
jgi:adenosylcobinamide-phosphate synthase